MAIYTFGTPDGKTLEIEGPDNATPEQISQAGQAAAAMYAQQAPQPVPGAYDVPQLDAQGHVIQTQQPLPEPTLGEKLIGLTEAARAIPAQAAMGMGGYLKGTADALLGMIVSDKTDAYARAREGTQILQAEMEKAAAAAYQPKTRAGQEMTQTAMETMAALPPFMPELAPLAGAAAMPKAGTMAAQEVKAAAQEAGSAAAQKAKTAVKETVAPIQQAASETVAGLKEIMAKPEEAVGRSVGAAQTPAELERRTRAEMLGFTGESGLTKGQATRNFADLQFEKESAKLPEEGAPLRERVENQTATLISKFDGMVDQLQPFTVDPREIGLGVDKALVNRAEIRRKQIRSLYKKAEEAGDMAAPVTMEPLASRFEDLSRFEGVSPNIKTIRNEAQRLGAIATDDAGNIVPGTISVNDAEVLRQFVNEATDWTNRRESLFAKRITSAIDDATEDAGGALYKAARRSRKQFADEFENAGLTAKLIGTKRGSDERKIALGDVFDKIIVMSPIEEMNKTRGTLLKAGPEGKQAWQDLKAAGIDYIKEKALSPSQRDARGNPLLSPDKLQKTIRIMDKRGKLESLYGKKQAQNLRDLADIATDIYTAPPGAVNTSNTASALQVALDSVLTFGLTGIPAPAATALKEASKYVKNRETRARIREALAAPKEQK